MDLDGIIDWFKEQGIKVKRKWGPEGMYDNISIFGIGRYYEGKYKGARFTLSRSTMRNRGIRLLGIIVRFYYSQPCPLGLTCRYNVGVFSPVPHSYKDIMAKKFNSGIKGLRCWAVRRDIAQKLFQQEKVVRSITAIRNILNIPEESGEIQQSLGYTSGLWIDDKGIGIFIPTESNPTILKNVMDAMLDFCSAMDDFVILNGLGSLKAGGLQIVFTGIVIIVTILALFLFIWRIITAF